MLGGEGEGKRGGLAMRGHTTLDPSTLLRVSGPSTPGEGDQPVAPTGDGMDPGSGAGMTEKTVAGLLGEWLKR